MARPRAYSSSNPEDLLVKACPESMSSTRWRGDVSPRKPAISALAQMSMSCALLRTPPAGDMVVPSRRGTSAIRTGSPSSVIMYGEAVEPAGIRDLITVVCCSCSGSSPESEGRSPRSSASPSPSPRRPGRTSSCCTSTWCAEETCRRAVPGPALGTDGTGRAVLRGTGTPSAHFRAALTFHDSKRIRALCQFP